MQTPLVVRALTPDERPTLEAGLRSSDAFVLRRCQMLLASAGKQHTTAIARSLHGNDHTVRNAIHACTRCGLAALTPGSSRPHRTQAAIDERGRERLRALLHQSPRTFGQPTSLWPLAVVAEVRVTQGLTTRQVSGETMRATLARMGVRWQRAKPWITSPAPASVRKKNRATA